MRVRIRVRIRVRVRIGVKVSLVSSSARTCLFPAKHRLLNYS